MLHNKLEIRPGIPQKPPVERKEDATTAVIDTTANRIAVPKGRPVSFHHFTRPMKDPSIVAVVGKAPLVPTRHAFRTNKEFIRDSDSNTLLDGVVWVGIGGKKLW